MSARRRAGSNAAKLAELGLAAPLVVAHRIARMALAGPLPSARDRLEFAEMVIDKQVAFAKGIAPVHRKAVGNARRLARTRIR